jgi:hypothetical protein
MNRETFTPTHQITIQHRNGDTETMAVRVVNGDCWSAYEWRWNRTAAWQIHDGRLTFEGEPSPSDRAYRISRIPDTGDQI